MESLSLGATQHLVCDFAFVVSSSDPISQRIWLTKLDQLQFVNIPFLIEYRVHRPLGQSTLRPTQQPFNPRSFRGDKRYRQCQILQQCYILGWV